MTLGMKSTLYIYGVGRGLPGRDFPVTLQNASSQGFAEQDIRPDRSDPHP